jgi:hypothetical protein
VVTIVQYLVWHYTIAPGDILHIGHNYIASVWHRFLIPKHLATLVAPWHRMSAALLAEDQTLSTRAANFFMEPILRSVGLIIRLAVIGAGLLTEGAVATSIALVLVVWFAWPFLTVISLITGSRLIIP